MKRKRWRTPKAKPGELKAQWGKSPHDDPDLFCCWGEGTHSADSRLLLNVFGGKRFLPGSFDFDDSFIDELKKRGYDITTIKFSIQKKDIP